MISYRQSDWQDFKADSSPYMGFMYNPVTSMLRYSQFMDPPHFFDFRAVKEVMDGQGWDSGRGSFTKDPEETLTRLGNTLLKDPTYSALKQISITSSEVDNPLGKGTMYKLHFLTS